MEVIQSTQERCENCRRLKQGACISCLNDFKNRPRVLYAQEAMEELVGWKKADLPIALIVKRATELTDRAVKPREVLQPTFMRGILKEIAARALIKVK